METSPIGVLQRRIVNDSYTLGRHDVTVPPWAQKADGITLIRLFLHSAAASRAASLERASVRTFTRTRFNSFSRAPFAYLSACC